MATCPCSVFHRLGPGMQCLAVVLRNRPGIVTPQGSMQTSCVVAQGSHAHVQTHKQKEQPQGALYEGISVNIQWQSRCWWPCEVEAVLRAWCGLISTTNIQERSELVIPVKTPTATHSPDAILLLQHTAQRTCPDSCRRAEKGREGITCHALTVQDRVSVCVPLCVHQVNTTI